MTARWRIKCTQGVYVLEIDGPEGRVLDCIENKREEGIIEKPGCAGSRGKGYLMDMFYSDPVRTREALRGVVGPENLGEEDWGKR